MFGRWGHNQWSKYDSLSHCEFEPVLSASILSALYLGRSENYGKHFLDSPKLRFWKQIMFYHLDVLMSDLGRQKRVIFLWLLNIVISKGAQNTWGFLGPVLQCPSASSLGIKKQWWWGQFLIVTSYPQTIGHHGHHSPVSWIWEAVAKAMALVSGITSVAMSKWASTAPHWIGSVYAQSFQEIQPMICFCTPPNSAVNI